MIRLSNQEVLASMPNRFDTILIAAQRIRELNTGHAALVPRNDMSNVSVALTEISEKKIGREYLKKIRYR